MEYKAISRFIRISPRKTRLVADIIRGKNAIESQQLLETVNKRAAGIIGKTLNSVISNAKQKEVKEESLWIKKIVIDGGPIYKRYMPRAMGRATMIRHPTSHITIVLSDEERILKSKEAGVIKKGQTQTQITEEKKITDKKSKPKEKKIKITKEEESGKKGKEKKETKKEKKVRRRGG